MDALLDRVADARAVLIAGPTASGKSAAALMNAERAARIGRGALIVNADSMQVYDTLRVLTARPDQSEERRAPHRLYGHVPATSSYSVGTWLRDAAAAVAEAERAGAVPVLVGGTGLYFKALLEGIAEVPDVPAELRARWSGRLTAEGPEALHRELARRDEASAAALRPRDSQRIVRALEVLDATGISLREWQQRRTPSLLAGTGVLRAVLEPERKELYARIEARFERMVATGALDEIRALMAQSVSPSAPVMKALGVRQLAAALVGETSLDDAVATAKRDSRRYAKRQMTWFRNQMRDWERIPV